ncbi:response regulator [Hymenobacter norwichensis]|uniref:response regulator n=1 Tax=Hymenobacter norwichensis TaxID=223903 RepID=UPI00041EB33D|nr:response regulator transcription factor [Hymenobacter norwichensis]
MIRLFLVDDHAVLRHGLRTLFQQEPALQVVDKAENGEQLLAQLPTTPCDVVLLDLHMPGLDGLATTQRLHAEFPDVRILVLSMVDNERHRASNGSWGLGLRAEKRQPRRVDGGRTRRCRQPARQLNLPLNPRTVFQPANWKFCG